MNAIAHLSPLIASLAGCTVHVLGDVMLDEYLMGDAQRISPEAPVPVVLATAERRLLGGAGNVARNIRFLGGNPHLIGLCGEDAAAVSLRETLNKEGITSSLITDCSRPTTQKWRILARNQQVLRIDKEECSPAGPKILDAVFGELEQAFLSTRHQPQVLILSDYGKGMFSPAFMERLQSFLKNLAQPCRILVDPKPGNFRLYQGAYLLTPNLKEAAEGSGLPTETSEQILTAGRAILDSLGCKNLLVTLGANGMALFQADGKVCHIPSVARTVFDVTGAGDTVIAVTGLALAAGLPLLDSCLLANQAAGLVVGEVGAASVTPDQLHHAIQGDAGPEVEYWA